MSTNNEDKMPLNVKSNLLIAKHVGEECECDLIIVFLDINLH